MVNLGGHSRFAVVCLLSISVQSAVYVYITVMVNFNFSFNFNFRSTIAGAVQPPKKAVKTIRIESKTLYSLTPLTDAVSSHRSSLTGRDFFSVDKRTCSCLMMDGLQDSAIRHFGLDLNIEFGIARQHEAKRTVVNFEQRPVRASLPWPLTAQLPAIWRPNVWRTPAHSTTPFGFYGDRSCYAFIATS
jgi:hypothetical protein